jgi:hypothetical protein
MKHTTRLALTVSALTALLCACGSEQQEKGAPVADKASAPAAASEAHAAPEAPAVAEAPAPKAEAPAVAPAALEPAPAARTAEGPAVEKPAAETAKEPEAPPAVGYEVGKRIPAYKNTVRRPGAASSTGEAFDTHATTKPTLYIANSTTCPYCTAYIDRMKSLEKTYMEKGVDVVHVYPVREQTAESKAAHHAAKGFQGGLIDDKDAAFAKALDIHKTPTAILTDASGKIVYRGRIDDNAKAEKVHVHELADAIDATLAGKTVQVATTEPFG